MNVKAVILEYRQFPGQRLSVSDLEGKAGWRRGALSLRSLCKRLLSFGVS